MARVEQAACRSRWHRRLKIISGALLALWVGVVGTSQPARAEIPPPAAPLAYGSLKFDESTFDFGDVYRGSALVHRFRFVNGGPGPLVIHGVHAACGCTAAEVDKGRRYEPGQSGYVEVTLNTTDYMGSLLKTVTVMSNEKPIPDRTLTLKAFVKGEVEADPPLIDFGDVRAAVGGKQVIRVRPVPATAAPVAVRELLYNRSVFEAAAVASGKEWVVAVILKPGHAPGFLKETLRIRNDSRHLSELPVPIRANIIGNIDASPAYLEFGAIDARGAESRTLTLKSLTPFDIKGSRAELKLNGKALPEGGSLVKVVPKPFADGQRPVVLELKHGAGLVGNIHGRVVLTTSDPAQREVSVDFYAFFR